MEYFPLISVIVFSYNSEEYILSTLESIKTQTYPGPVELIIGDDCSKDNSIEICRRWVDENKEKFTRVEIISHTENKGVVENYNSCLKKSQGEWIKGIAADDVLMPDALQILYTTAINNGADFVQSGLLTFFKDEELNSPENLTYLSPGKREGLVTLKDVMQKPNFWMNAPSFFMRRESILQIGYIPTLFRNIEDRPLFCKFLASGYKIYRLATPTVYYRQHPQSLSSTKGDSKFGECNWITYKEILRPCFTIPAAIDIDLRLLPGLYLGLTKKKNLKYRFIRLCCQLAWLIWRGGTFWITSWKYKKQ
ncbi:MAG: glycosyltransferase family 2 protein [Akkermansiaceae bacterium]|nr:glycosyltransferase family 2 protein [Akkermansiaceae bacterium]